MANTCPKCGQSNRPGARFCSVCGGALTAPAPVAPTQVASPQVVPAAATAAASAPTIGHAVAEAGAALLPLAKKAAIKGWAGSARGMGFVARVTTVGGRAAYAELFRPAPAGEGQVTGMPGSAAVPAPVEPAALLFALSLLAVWLVFALPTATLQGIALAGLLAALLALSWLGVRRPYFTRMTFDGLFARIKNHGHAAQVPIYKFQVVEPASGRHLDVVMIGLRSGQPPSPGATVEMWGIRHPAHNELRAWRVETVDTSGQATGVLAAPRLIPLTVALFLPALLALLVWVVSLIV